MTDEQLNNVNFFFRISLASPPLSPPVSPQPAGGATFSVSLSLSQSVPPFAPCACVCVSTPPLPPACCCCSRLLRNAGTVRAVVAVDGLFWCATHLSLSLFTSLLSTYYSPLPLFPCAHILRTARGGEWMRMRRQEKWEGGISYSSLSSWLPPRSSLARLPSAAWTEKRNATRGGEKGRQAWEEAHGEGGRKKERRS